MRNITIDLKEKSYEIIIEYGILNFLSKHIGDLIEGKNVAIITDSNVAPLYSRLVKDELEKCADSVSVIVVDAGEKSKSLETVSWVAGDLLSMGITRNDCLIALGGGVVGDLCGFISSVFLRGIPYIGIPTTLLAQVDSSVGGKTAVNLKEGKNLIGTFHQPSRVIIDPMCLTTLPKEEFSCGMAEVIKYAVIRDAQLFKTLNCIDNFSKVAEDVIQRCCEIKAEIVEHDEFDRGERMLLNFGHTIGHAVEKFKGYGTITHGAGVAIGMCLVSFYSEVYGCTERGTTEKIIKICEKYSLPTNCPRSESILEAVAYDKKNMGDDLHLIIAEKIGTASIQTINRETFLSQFKRIW